MTKPMNPAVLSRIADYLQRVHNYGIAESVQKATQIVSLMQSCGVEVVMPGWLIPDSPAARQRRGWEDLAQEITVDLTDRKPWLPQ